MNNEKLDFIINDLLEKQKQLTFENTLLKADIYELKKLKEQMEESLVDKSKDGVDDDN